MLKLYKQGKAGWVWRKGKTQITSVLVAAVLIAEWKSWCFYIDIKQTTSVRHNQEEKWIQPPPPALIPKLVNNYLSGIS